MSTEKDSSGSAGTGAGNQPEAASSEAALCQPAQPGEAEPRKPAQPDETKRDGLRLRALASYLLDHLAHQPPPAGFIEALANMLRDERIGRADDTSLVFRGSWSDLATDVAWLMVDRGADATQLVDFCERVQAKARRITEAASVDPDPYLKALSDVQAALVSARALSPYGDDILANLRAERIRLRGMR